jgi:hypothetical protein
LIQQTGRLNQTGVPFLHPPDLNPVVTLNPLYCVLEPAAPPFCHAAIARRRRPFDPTIGVIGFSVGVAVFSPVDFSVLLA